MKVPFSYLPEQFAQSDIIFEDIKKIVSTGDFTLGKAVNIFEKDFANLIGVRHAIGVNSGTDAIRLPLKALGIGPGDEVITCANTFIATVSAIADTGAKTVFVDCLDDFCMDLSKLEDAITSKTKAIIPVHLSGAMVDMERLLAISDRLGIPVIEDACQAINSKFNGRSAGSLGLVGSFSLHPLKFLNIWGDGGVITTNNDDLAKSLRLLRNHGLESRDVVVSLGCNSRLDSIQAVVASHVLAQTEWITKTRIKNSQFYDEQLKLIPQIKIPNRDPKNQHTFVTYQIFAQKRDLLLQFCLEKQVECKIHYPIPLYCQEGLRHLGYRAGDFPVTDRHAKSVITLPVHQYLSNQQLDFVVTTIKSFTSENIISMKKINYINLANQFKEERQELMPLIERVLESGMYIGGEEVEKLEEEIASYVGTQYAVTLNSGTDALSLGMVAAGIKPGDEVITPPNSFVASTASIIQAGAVPVFADIGFDGLINPSSISDAITTKTVAIMPVHLWGSVCDMSAINKIADKHKLIIIEDASQAMGAKYRDKYTGSLGLVGCFSAHPLKIFNAAGDAGFITTDSKELADRVKLLRNHGLVDRDNVSEFGHVSRLDTIQAVILRFRLKRLDSMINSRRKNAALYQKYLKETPISLPVEKEYEFNTFSNFVIQSESRDDLQKYLLEQGIQTSVYYNTPIHLQKAALSLGFKRGQFPVTEQLAKTILAIPANQTLKEDEIKFISDEIKNFFS